MIIESLISGHINYGKNIYKLNKNEHIIAVYISIAK